jgi:hypothetical protein
MKVSLKLWKIGVYFGSIALAVGIGVFQVGNEGVTIGNTLPSCNSYGLLTKNCKTDGVGNNVDECSAEAAFVLNVNAPLSVVKFTSYIEAPVGQVNCFGCPVPMSNYEEKGTAPEGCTN